MHNVLLAGTVSLMLSFVGRPETRILVVITLTDDHTTLNEKLNLIRATGCISTQRIEFYLLCQVCAILYVQVNHL